MTTTAYAAATRLTVVGRAGAVVRRDSDLGSPVVATLARGAEAIASGRREDVEKDGKVKARVELERPCVGWLSASMVAEAAAGDTSYAREVDVATALAVSAGEAILRIRASAALDTTMKPGGQGPVTAADFAADALICDGLRAAFPGDAIVSEEGANDDEEGRDRCWYVDPLDGTKNFVLPSDDPVSADWCVLVGLVVDGIAVAGVVHQPDAGKTWAGRVAADGTAAATLAVDGGPPTPLPRLAAKMAGDAPIVFAASPPVHPRFASAVGAFTKRPATTFPKGSAGLKAAAVADGSAHFYPSSFRGMHSWDVAAGHALCRAVGGDLEDLEGRAFAYGKDAVSSGGVLFRAPAVDDALKSKLREMYASFARARGGK